MTVLLQLSVCEVGAIICDDALWEAESHHKVSDFFSDVAPLAFLIGLASIHLLNSSIATRRNSQPPRDDLLSFPICPDSRPQMARLSEWSSALQLAHEVVSHKTDNRGNFQLAYLHQ